MESTLRLAQWTVYGLAILMWAGALVFAGYRNHQMNTLKLVRAEVVEAGTRSYMSSDYGKDADGWGVETKSRMYSATAKVRYEFEGTRYETEASHDVGLSSKEMQERLTREWKPGSWIWVRIDPARPDAPIAGLGWNLNTFLPSFSLALFGLVMWAAGYGVGKLLPMMRRIIGGLRGVNES